MAVVQAGAAPAPPRSGNPFRLAPAAMRLAWVERWLVTLVAVHSIAVGAMLLLAPGWSLSFAGWEAAGPLFFPRQAGAFHLVVAFAYLYEHRRLSSVTLLVLTKAFACVFLLSAAALGEAAWAVPFSGVADGLMGATALAVHLRRVRLSRRAG